MPEQTQNDDLIRSIVSVEYPDFLRPCPCSGKIREPSDESQFFKMLGHSIGAFIPVIDLTNAIFRDLTISDYHKELMVLMVGAYENVTYEWEQHITIAQVAGVRPDQFVAIAEGRLDDKEAFTERERVLLHFGKSIIEKGKAPGVLFKHTRQHFSVEELSDAIIVIGYYRTIAAHIQTFNIAIDAQVDGNWIKG